VTELSSFLHQTARLEFTGTRLKAISTIQMKTAHYNQLLLRDSP